MQCRDNRVTVQETVMKLSRELIQCSTIHGTDSLSSAFLKTLHMKTNKYEDERISESDM